MNCSINFTKFLTKHASRSRNSEDDEDSGEEKISSAIFLPHQVAQEATRGHGERLDPITNFSSKEISSSEEWLEEHILSRKNSETYSHQSKTARSLFNNAESSLEISTDENDNLTNTHGKLEMRINTRDDQLFEKGTKSQIQFEEVTPNGSPNIFFPRIEETSKSYTDPQPVMKKPLEAIELIPYSHQVGGHTTLWRFSKRAVCKQLNNRENEFYEKIEQRHPQLLRFLPRYIGVLNVTFERQNRNKNPRKEVQESLVESLDSKQYNSVQVTHKQEIRPVFKNGNHLENNISEHKRAKSQSCIFDHLQPVPTVTFADNRHIIPTSILKPQPVFCQNQSRSYSASSTFSQTIDHGLNDDRRISLNLPRDSSEPNPWGKTFVNKVLREDVFREVFLQKPVAIRHKKSAANRSSAYCSSNFLRSSNSELNLQTAHQGEHYNEFPLQLNADVSREHFVPKESMADIDNCTLKDSNKKFCDEISANDRIGRSAQEPKAICARLSKSGKLQRRYSSGGLRRRPAEVADGRGSLNYYEEADDTVPESNSEEIHSIEPEPANRNTYFSKTKNAQVVLEKINSAMEENYSSTGLSKSLERSFTAERNSASNSSNSQIDIPRPVNPKEARAQPGSRVEYFLLIEDLTAGMKRPCVMDLKMGTRQYGVDSDLKKQESQRQKCAATTSRRFGVRVCGLQVWDVYLQDYIFEDKYYGRNLKNGEDFQKALTRFLYDGLDYYSVLRHIPSIIEKLSELEVLIRGLTGYRFYGTSLLMFYDGATEEGYSSDSTVTEKDDRSTSRGIDFKIADFANCVTQEDFERQRSCPPKHPKKPDLGFLRGLKTLKRYFLAIEREARKEKGYTTFQNTRTGKEFNYLDESDEGYVSY
ncbi:KCS1/inositol hexaphosphate kinase KCS1 [Erysiphe neolycopersici]|uniref:Kinase n=1 Tax=Erysiphe neolycopersici TaxID=212602 RepID=A0A420H7G0_9PEZI|nr:KCS1/inositol hexaphosphate kinase KCS1 [Erysiphe neolycopersici]